MSILTATVTTVKIGPVSVEGLMNENGDFAIAVPQFADHFQFDKGQASRAIKSLMGKDFQFAKWKTELNPKAVNVIPIQDVERMILELALKGNTNAIAITRALVGLSLHQLFADAFGLKFEKEDRQRWLVERDICRYDFRPLTDQLKRYGFETEYARFVWAFQAKAGLKSGERDSAPAMKLAMLNKIQTRLITLMECGFDPWEALRRI